MSIPGRHAARRASASGRPAERERVDERRLSFGEHLEELRGHVIRALIYLAVIGVGCLFFQEELMRFVVAPHVRAMEEIAAARRAKAAEDEAARRARDEALLAAALRFDDALAAARGAGADPDARAAAAERVAAAFSALSRAAAAAPSAAETTEAAGRDGRLRFLGYSEPFFAYLKVAFICALFVASPLVIRELWRFVAAGLYPHEQRWVKIFGPLSFLCFLGGCAFGYWLLVPQTLKYLASYGDPDLFAAAVSIDGYLEIFLGLTAAIGLVFELPLILVFLSLVNLVTAPFLREYRRYWIFLATVIAAVITPTGDPWTLSVVAIPLILLYEFGILCVRMVEKARLGI
jgi:Tat protein translocase TatC